MNLSINEGLSMVILLDTGFILAFRNKKDKNHISAMETMKKRIMKGEYGRAVVTDYVYDELMTLIQNRLGNKSFMEATAKFLKSSPRISFLWISEELFLNTIKKFEKYFDQRLSFTDCTFLSLAETITSKCYVASFDETLGKFAPEIVP